MYVSEYRAYLDQVVADATKNQNVRGDEAKAAMDRLTLAGIVVLTEVLVDIKRIADAIEEIAGQGVSR